MNEKQKLIALIIANESEQFARVERSYKRNLITLHEFMRLCGEIAAERDALVAVIARKE